MNVRKYLISLVIIPFIGILAVASLELKSAYDRLTRANFAEATVAVTIPVGDLVHVLQVERGMSAGFIASGGKNFAAELPEHRELVDFALDGARLAVEKKRNTYPEEVQTFLMALTDFSDMRPRVDSLDVSVGEMAKTFTDAVRAAIVLNEMMLSHLNYGELAGIGAGWIALTEAKEAAGLERAMGATGFGSGAFEPDILQKFVQFGAMQSVTLSVFAKYSDLIGEPVNPVMLPENQALGSLRTAVLTNDQSAIESISGVEWFAASTAWIERMRSLEVDVEHAVTDFAANATRQAYNDLAINLVSSGLALLASFICGLFVTRRFAKGFAHLTNVTSQIASKQFDVSIKTDARVQEIDDLAQTLSDMRDHLRSSDEKLSEAFSKSFAFGDSDTAMIIVGTDLAVQFLNASAARLFENHQALFDNQLKRFNAKDPIGTSLDGLMSEEFDMSALLADQSQMPWRGDIAVGDVKLELNISIVSAENGTRAGNVIQARDVTEERLHAGMIGAIDRQNGVVEFSCDGTVLSTNEKFDTMMEQDQSQLRGMTCKDLATPETWSTVVSHEKWATLLSGKSLSGRLQLKTPSSKARWVRAGFNPILDSNGDVFKVSMIANDITDIVESADARESDKAKAEAERSHVVSSLAQGLQDLANGNLSCRIDAQFADEYLGLRSDFNSAVDNLAGAIRSVKENADQLQLTSAELSSSSSDLATRTERQASRLTQTATALDEVTATVQQTVNQVQEADQAVSVATANAEENEVAVKDAMRVMDLIASSSSEISSITTLIDDISFQTNLLALNAGVEAARAGEAGRGFAVVASEVRALAQRAATAASDINELISKSKTHVENGVDLVSGVGVALTEICSQIAVVNTSVQGIRSATEEQAITLKQVNESVGEIGELTQQNAAMGEESSALSSTLKEDADTLSNTVARFDVSNSDAKIETDKQDVVYAA